MVEEVGYTSRVRVQAGQALPGVSADSFGAGVGQALSQAGAVINQERLEDARLDRQLRDNAEWSAAMVADAEERERLQMLIPEARKTDAPGHAERIAAEVAKSEERLLGMVTSPRLKQQMQARLAEWGGSVRSREANFEVLRGQEKTVQNVEQTLKFLDGEVRRANTPLEHDKIVKAYVDGVAGLDIPDEIKAKFDIEIKNRAAVGFVRGQIDRNPGGARALLDTGFFDGILTGDQVEVLRNGAEVEIRRLEEQRERERKAQVQGIDQKIDLFETREAAGLVTDPSEFAAPIALAKALGDNDRVVKLEVAQANAAFLRVWGPDNATAVQRSNRLAELNRKGDNRTDRDTLELNFLRKHASAWASEEADDPTGQAIRMGGRGAPPPLDINDPESIAARARWAKVTGRPFMGNDEVATQLTPVWESGAQGQEQVLAVLNRLPPAQAMDAARRLDPDDITLPIIATLPQRYRNAARRGQAWVRDSANRKEWNEQLGGGVSGQIDPDIMATRRSFETALDLYPEDQKLAVIETAEAMLAGYYAIDRKPLTPERYEMALTMALGGVKKNGEWHGGLGRWGQRSFLLPEGVSVKGFTGAVTRDVQASKDPPVNPDGSTANLFRLIPVSVGAGVYEFRNAAGYAVRRKSGREYRIRVKP